MRIAETSAKPVEREEARAPTGVGVTSDAGLAMHVSLCIGPASVGRIAPNRRTPRRTKVASPPGGQNPGKPRGKSRQDPPIGLDLPRVASVTTARTPGMLPHRIGHSRRHAWDFGHSEFGFAPHTLSPFPVIGRPGKSVTFSAICSPVESFPVGRFAACAGSRWPS